MGGSSGSWATGGRSTLRSIRERSVSCAFPREFQGPDRPGPRHRRGQTDETRSDSRAGAGRIGRRFVADAELVGEVNPDIWRRGRLNAEDWKGTSWPSRSEPNDRN